MVGLLNGDDHGTFAATTSPVGLPSSDRISAPHFIPAFSAGPPLVIKLVMILPSSVLRIAKPNPPAVSVAKSSCNREASNPTWVSGMDHRKSRRARAYA